MIVLPLVTLMFSGSTRADPKATVRPARNPDPNIVTAVPPAAGPEAGVIEMIIGLGNATGWLPTAIKQVLLVAFPMFTENP
jgi:hypothetical protein